MSKRLWYPEILIDEITPAGRATPEAWLDFIFLDDLDEDDRALSRLYAPGSEIPFKWAEHRGTLIVAVNRDGTTGTMLRCPETPDMFTGETSPVPPGLSTDINAFWNDDLEIWAPTLEEFVHQCASLFEFSDDDQMDFEADLTVWSSTIIFKINADGKGLTRITPEEAQP